MEKRVSEGCCPGRRMCTAGRLPSPEPAARSAALGAVLAPERALEELRDLCGEFKASFKLPRLH